MKKSLAIFFILFFSFIFVQIAESQSVGDYRTKSGTGTANWTDAVWDNCVTAGTWNTSFSGNPGNSVSSNITIQSSANITYNSGTLSWNSGNISLGGTLTIASSSVFDITSTAGIFTSSGTTNIYGTLKYRKASSTAYPNYNGSAYVDARTSYGTSGTCEIYSQPDNVADGYYSFMGSISGSVGSSTETFYNLSLLISFSSTSNYLALARTKPVISNILTIDIKQLNNSTTQPDVGLTAVQDEIGMSCGKLILNNGEVWVSSTATNVDRFFTVNSDFEMTGGTLDINNSDKHHSTFLVKGNFSQSGGTLTKTGSKDGKIKFGGSSNQTIDISSSGPGTPSGYSVEIDNSNGVTLNSNFTVPGTLTITNGLLKTGSYVLTLDGFLSISSPNSSNMIVLDDGTNLGTLKRKLSASYSEYLFYVGDSRGTTEYSPVTLTFTGTTFSNAYVKLKLKNEKHVDNSSDFHYIDRYWEITTEGTLNSLNYYIRLQYDDVDIHGTEANMILGKLNGSTWEPFGSPITSGNYFEKSGLTSFSTFTGGEEGALPISLSTFNYSVIGKDIKLSWSTSEEINNSGFDVERKSVSSDWQKVGFVQGNNKPSKYEFTERNLTTGKYQYRLKQIDFNGNFEYHNLDGYVEVGVPAKFDLSQNYPNPFNPVTNISYQVASSGVVKITVYDMLGKEVKTLVNEFKEPGYYNMNFDAGNLNSGIYFYKMSVGTFSSVKKLVLIK